LTASRTASKVTSARAKDRQQQRAGDNRAQCAAKIIENLNQRAASRSRRAGI
jgi:hypothetical protein